MISGPLTAKKLASVSWATARAISVLPQPGGPSSSTPLGASMPSRSNSSGYRSGNSTISRTRSKLPPQAADVFVGDRGRRRRPAGRSPLRRRRSSAACRTRSTTGPCGAGALDLEIGVAVAEQRGPHAVAGDDRQAVQQAADVFQVAVGGAYALRIEHHFRRPAGRRSGGRRPIRRGPRRRFRG